MAALEAKLQSATGAKATKELEKELKKERTSLAKVSKAMDKAAKAAEKARQQQLKQRQRSAGAPDGIRVEAGAAAAVGSGSPGRP